MGIRDGYRPGYREGVKGSDFTGRTRLGLLGYIQGMLDAKVSPLEQQRRQKAAEAHLGGLDRE